MSEPWNFLVYIAADNALYADAQINLQQITNASLFTKIEMLVQFDGPTADFASRYECSNGVRTTVWEAPDGYTSDRGQRLTDFLDFAVAEGFAGPRRVDGQPTPQQTQTFLVLWGHGAGLDHVYLYSNPQAKGSQNPSLPGRQTGTPGKDTSDTADSTQASAASMPSFIPLDLLNSDDSHANRYLSDMRLASILENFASKLGREIDVLGFDSCLMGMAEIFHEFAPSVSLAVASDEEVPRGSWPYDSILQDLTRFPGMDASTLSAVIVSRFIERYATQGKKTRVSLSTFKLSASEQLAAAMTALVEALTAVLGNGAARRRILHARDFSRTADVADYIDLGVFCKELAGAFKDEATVVHAANEALSILLNQPYILYHRDAGENGAINPLGLAIYFPQVLPPTSTELSTAVQSENGLQSHTAMAAAPLTVGEPTKTVGEPTKTVGEPTKTVGEPTKTVGGRGVDRELLGSEVLWDFYLQLKFNQETNWANLVEALITGKPATAKAS